jgi:hypothetical protein
MRAMMNTMERSGLLMKCVPIIIFKYLTIFYFGLSLIINIKIFLIGQRSFRLASSER